MKKLEEAQQETEKELRSEAIREARRGKTPEAATGEKQVLRVRVSRLNAVFAGVG